jgi:imidazoleglycerol-phosphate dehydratase / histidinol-phosphatase
MKAIFIEREGAIIRMPADARVDSLEKLEFIPGVITGLRKLVDKGYTLILATEQEGLATAAYPLETFDMVQKRLLSILEGEGIRFDKIFISPVAADGGKTYRKPDRGVLGDFLKINTIDTERSYVIGRSEVDTEFAKNIGCRSIILIQDTKADGSSGRSGDTADLVAERFTDAVDFILQSDRIASVSRKTTETDIAVTVSLDGMGSYDIHTGVGFFDHMLEQIAKHSLIDIRIDAKGDLHIDEHHTVEDTGLALGECIRTALGDKKGVGRYGFVMPMDESQARIALDLGGRPFFRFEGTFTRERVGEFSTELVEDFFRGLADGLRANLHISVDGRNDHHKIEAIFKGVARSLREAVRIDPRAESAIPSTKGVL